ncbi:MAG: hypothetical protein QXE01_07135 [Sulfolobales archaeon]
MSKANRNKSVKVSSEIDEALGLIVVRGEEALKKIYEGGGYKGYKYIVIVAPISRAYLLYEDILKEIRSFREMLVIPSSYDDVATYVNMRREGYRICSRQAVLGDIMVICLERGERPWGRISMSSGGYKIIFSEDLDPIDVENIFWGAGLRDPGVIYISYGVTQPVGIRVGLWISIRLNPFINTISKIRLGGGYIDMGVEILGDIYRYISVELRSRSQLDQYL